jgi:epoxyqueuosine reductase
MIKKINNQVVTEIAKSLGFDLVGFAKAEVLEDEILLYESWLLNNFHAKMNYMTKNLDKKKDVTKILPTVRSVISLGMNYYKKSDFSDLPSGAGKVSRYAWGKDYHIIIKEKLKQLEYELKEIDENFEAISYVDTGPVIDKVWAVKAGLGWMGKHTNIINRNIGSWFFIANVFCNQEFDYSNPIADFCGNCNACIEACPTEAIIAPYVLDSNKCISYQTIENKEDIPEDLKNKFGDWAFGCDICQDVCPWNQKFEIETSLPEFEPINKFLIFREIDKMSENDFNTKYKDSPIKRSKLKGIRRNLSFLGLNQSYPGDGEIINSLD